MIISLGCQNVVIIPLQGCDTTSAFHGKGKATALETAKKEGIYLEAFGSLGSDFYLSEETKSRLFLYTCDLYGSKGECSNVDLLRYQIFKGGKFGEEYMPPNSDSLQLHLQRANYQRYLWRHAMMPNLNAPDIRNHGWRIEDGRVSIQWMNLAPAPDSILAFVNCSCKKGCENNRCSCFRANMRCSDLCKCSSCLNASKNNESVDSDDDDLYQEDVNSNDFDDESELDDF